jgi:hypothetical protein
VSTIVRARTASVTAVVLGVVALGLGAASVLVDSLTHQPGTGGPAADAFFAAVGAVPATAVGTLLAARRPRNPIGWMLLAIRAARHSPSSCPSRRRPALTGERIAFEKAEGVLDVV